MSASKDSQEQDCAVCLQKCYYPTKLPCGHIFCFLCVKGVALQSKKCAMCRAQIPPDYLNNPVLLNNSYTEDDNKEYQWYYEGKNGWWKYDEYSNTELENVYSEGTSECTLLVAGALYCVDFIDMIQIRCNDPVRRRRVRRDSPSLPAKGIAGIKTAKRNTVQATSESQEDSIDLNVESLYQHVDEIHHSTLDDDNIYSEEIADVLAEISAINIHDNDSASPLPEDT